MDCNQSNLFNLDHFMLAAKALCDCGIKNYKEDIAVLKLINKYISFRDKRFFQYPSSTTIKFMGVQNECTDILNGICRAVSLLIPYGKVHWFTDENGLQLTIRLPYGKGRYYYMEPRLYHYQHKNYTEVVLD
jgi:hypothetical protein